LQSVLNGLPPDLKDRVRDLDIRGATMTISLERILAQLPSGSVKISFGSLRHAAPQLFSVGADCDSRDVALPLNEILAKINPAMICPPQGQPARGPVESERSIAPDTSTPAHPELETPQRGSSLSVPPMAAPGETADAPQTEPTASPRAVTHKPASKVPPIRVPTPQKAKPAKEPSGAADSGPSINVDLASLTADWPAELRQEIAQWNLPEARIALPADTVREGLKRGRVAFSWQTLRPWITPQPPATESAHDKATLELPLAVIAPLFLAGQKHSAKPATPDHDGGKQSTREEIPDIFFDSRFAQQSNGENGHDTAAPVVSSQTSAPSQEVPVAPRADVADSRNARSGLSGAANTSSRLAPDGQTSSRPALRSASDEGEPAQRAGDQSVMRIPLKELTELWPENIRTEVAHWNLEQLMVALPAERINAALKQGKVVFAWENLRSWILPSPPSAAALQDKVLLELPLPVIMPLFLAGRKQSSKAFSKPVPQIADDIPDPFADFLPGGKSASTESKEIPVPATAKAAPTAPGAGHPSTAPKPNAKSAGPPTPGEKSPGTDSITRQKTPAALERSRGREGDASATPATVQNTLAVQSPADVLATALNLDGVVGALIALSDGFKVASKLPPGMDGDALAAFLPHIFSKVNQSARELRMGDLNNLNFTVDNVPWKIFRVNQIFFAALGHAGKPMPTDELANLAHKLTFKN
jgi:predicted regulator of Ras-like GTPase activity (Roadblock/LC7/MglB family)